VQRLNNLKKYGLLNVGNKRALVTLLTGTDKIQDINKNWPQNVDIEVVHSKENHRTTKLIEYFLNYDPKKLEEVRWIAKFDDDILNDITGLVYNLDKTYDHTEEYYIVTELRSDIEAIDAEMLRQAGYGKWVLNGNQTVRGIYHELEGSILSNACLAKILSTPTAVQFLKIRSKQHIGHTDVPIAHAAQMAKVFPCEACFITQHPMVGHFSFFGNGTFNHIHYIAEDRNPQIFQIIKKLLGKESYEEPYLEIHNAIKDGEFIFGNVNEPTRPFSVLKLSSSGIIHGGNFNEAIWIIKRNAIEILNTSAEITTILEYKGNNDYMEGHFVQDPQIKHFIRRLK